MDRLGFHLIEHRGFFIEEFEKFLGLGMNSRYDNSHVFFSSRFFSFDFYSFKVITFLLSCFIKPIREKTRSLCLLLVEAIHSLCVLQFVVFLGFCLYPLLFFPHSSSFLFQLLLPSFSTTKHFPYFLMGRTIKSRLFCFHNNFSYIDSGCKFKNYF